MPTSRASSATGQAAGHVKKRMTRRRVVAAAAVIAVLMVGGTGYVLITGSGSSPEPNLLANGAFETGDLQGWQAIPPYLPTVESSVVANGSSYAARFQTPTNDPNVSSPCLAVGEGCGLLNVSTIYQNVYNLALSGGATFSFVVYTAFQYPSKFQVTLEFGLSPSAAASTGYSDVLLYYLVLASPQQCSTYSSYLLSSRPPGATVATHCLSARQGDWTHVERDVASDLPPGLTPSGLRGSMLTLSVSFAGASPTDETYAGSFDFG